METKNGDKNMKLDLHTHSTVSDGQYTPSELVEMAKKNELKCMPLQIMIL